MQRTQQRHMMLAATVTSSSRGEDFTALLPKPKPPREMSRLERAKERLRNRGDGVATVAMLVILTLATAFLFHNLFSVTSQESVRSHNLVEVGEESRSLDDDVDEPPPDLSSLLPFDLGARMREWLAKKQLVDGFFYTPPASDESLAKPYSAKEIVATIPHFTRELLLVMYAAATDEFIVLLPGTAGRPPPKCEAGCVRIENILHALLHAFRNRYFHRFQAGQPDLIFLVSTGDAPRLSRECLERPGGCGRRKKFAPILHFGSGFSDPTVLPSLITMPPPPRIHLRCMNEWQLTHEICEYLLPKRVDEDGRQTPGLVFGEHVNYNVNGAKRIGDKTDGIVWEDLIPQVIWRGTDFSYLNILYPDMRAPKYSDDVAPKVKEYGRGIGGIIRALNDVYDILRPRWKAVLITAQAEFEADAVNNNPKRKTAKKVLPWADMKFSAVGNDHAKKDISEDPYYTQWNSIGIPAAGNSMTSEEMALYKYHIDIGGGGGTTWEGTIQKLAMPGVLFHHETAAKDWYYEHLVPWIHYIPVKEDLSDLKEQFDWAERHDRKVRAIAKAGTEFVRRMGRPEGLDELYRRHFLKPLEDLLDAYQPMDELPPEFMNSGEDGIIFKEVMRCKGLNINEECPLLTD